jgi:hypothetical protein
MINLLLDKIDEAIKESHDKVAPYEYRDVVLKLREGDLLVIYRALQAMSAIRELVK